jgi:hypothetical protein
LCLALPKGCADLALEPVETAAVAAALLEVGQEVADPVGERLRRAEVEPPLPAPLPPGHLEVGAEAASAIGPPGRHDRALAGEKCRMGKEIRLDALEPREFFLANKIAFFRVGGL